MGCNPWGRKESDLTEQLNSNNRRASDQVFETASSQALRDSSVWASPGKGREPSNTSEVGIKAKEQSIPESRGWGLTSQLYQVLRKFFIILSLTFLICEMGVITCSRLKGSPEDEM